MSAFLATLKAAVAAKAEKNGHSVKEHVPHAVKYLEASGSYVASDGKTYVIKYEEDA